MWLAGEPTLHPASWRAQWFVESLHVVGACAVLAALLLGVRAAACRRRRKALNEEYAVGAEVG